MDVNSKNGVEDHPFGLDPHLLRSMQSIGYTFHQWFDFDDSTVSSHISGHFGLIDHLLSYSDSPHSHRATSFPVCRIKGKCMYPPPLCSSVRWFCHPLPKVFIEKKKDMLIYRKKQLSNQMEISDGNFDANNVYHAGYLKPPPYLLAEVNSTNASMDKQREEYQAISNLIDIVSHSQSVQSVTSNALNLSSCPFVFKSLVCYLRQGVCVGKRSIECVSFVNKTGNRRESIALISAS